jgi:hypothetical protein
MKHIISSLALIVLALIFFSTACSASDVPDDIRKAADNGINIFFKDSRMTGLNNLGFNNQADLDSAYAGEGFQLYAISSDRLLNESFVQDLSAMAVPTNQWLFIVHSTDGPRALLTVDIMNSKWTPVSIGAAGFARELSAIMTAWPESDGYSYRVIRVNEAGAIFVELSQGGNIVGLVPPGLRDGVYGPSAIKTSIDVLPDLKRSVEENIRAWKEDRK